jgi:predicted MFS family arabinose efflux permease
MTIETPVSGKKFLSRMFTPTLAFAYFASGISNTIITLMAVDISSTFLGYSTGVYIGITSQLSTINTAAVVVFALFLSIASIRFRGKPLFILGLTLILISALGSFLSLSLLSLQFFYALEGAGSIIIWVMAVTLIGDTLPPEKKAKAIGYLITINALSSLVTTFLVGYIAVIADWRASFLFLVLPISATVLVSSLFVLPSKPIEIVKAQTETSYRKNFKQVLCNKSATACLFADLLIVASGQISVFTLAYYRTVFFLSEQWIVLLVEIGTIFFIITPMISGYIINKVGAKRLAVVCLTLAATCLSLLFFMPYLYAAVALDMLHLFFGTLSVPAFKYLTLEQSPKHRVIMMSLNSLSNNIGNALAMAIGGAMLLLTSGYYGVVGLVFGGMTFIGVAVLGLTVKDTTKTSQT